MYDVAIVGTGTAGISAALTLTALKKSILWFGKKQLSEKISRAEKVLNYPGLAAVTGEQLQQAFSNQITAHGIEITEKTVTGIYPTKGYFTLLCNTEAYEAKSVILATGVEAVRPIEGELDFLGRGVSYCATCDGMLYRGKTIAVVCTAKEYEHEVSYLAELADKVFFIPLYPQPSVSAPNIELVKGTPLRVQGALKATQLVLKDRTLDIDGIFYLKAAIPPSVLLHGLATSEGHIAVDRDCTTNHAGCFAAGDCTGRPYQYAKAVGEGNVAAHAAVRYLAQKSK